MHFCISMILTSFFLLLILTWLNNTYITHCCIPMATVSSFFIVISDIWLNNTHWTHFFAFSWQQCLHKCTTMYIVHTLCVLLLDIFYIMSHVDWQNGSIRVKSTITGILKMLTGFLPSFLPTSLPPFRNWCNLYLNLGWSPTWCTKFLFIYI